MIYINQLYPRSPRESDIIFCEFFLFFGGWRAHVRNWTVHQTWVWLVISNIRPDEILMGLNKYISHRQ